MKSKNKKRISAVKNNIYALKLLWKMSPSLVFNMAFSRFLGYFEWLFYSAFFMRYVINSLETQKSFSTIMTFIIVTVVVFASMSLYHSYLDGKVFPIATAQVNKKLYQKIFKKARNVELECFEDSDFYDKYTLAIKDADTNLAKSVEVFFGVIFGAIASVCAFMFMFQVDKYSVLFILFPFIGNFIFKRVNSKIDYNRNKDMAPHNRKIDYINRVMYLK